MTFGEIEGGLILKEISRPNGYNPPLTRKGGENCTFIKIYQLTSKISAVFGDSKKVYWIFC